ncbi:VOC family protein [Rossellomorea aquimaris]|uniref:VOC family protein n=1 Tax=Rossellomorea aquimaris TaxID=189382 RepID=UPI001CD70DAC|nr:VOC family protein [Rossellomorea aquimaris]MCA1061058.1 VOC family protein [Rossellomorea aquimaris]
MKTIQGIKQIAVQVKDLRRATAFYQEKLGQSLLFMTDHMAFFDCQGVRLLLALPEKEEYTQSSVIYFEVNDIHTSYRKMKEKGVPFVDEPHLVAKMDDTETWMVFFVDTEGNTQALVSEM